MTSAVGGIDPHQDTFTLGIVDANGVETCHETFDNTAAGYAEEIDLLDAHGVCLVGVEGSAKWGAHVAIALAAARFDAREVPPSRSAAQRRSRRPGQDRRRRRGRLRAGAAGRADPGPRPGLGGLRPARRRDRGRARAPPGAGSRTHTGFAPCRRPDLQAAHRDPRPARQRRQDRSPAAPPRTHRPRQRHHSRRQIPARMAPSIHRPRQPSAPRDPPPRTAHRRAARPARHHTARRGRHRPHLRHPAVRGRRPDPVRPRDPSSPAGAAPAPSRSPQATATASPSSTGSTSAATDASTACCTSRRSPRPAASPTPPPCLARKTGEGKTRREARRAHKRHLANRVIRRMWRDEKHRPKAQIQAA